MHIHPSCRMRHLSRSAPLRAHRRGRRDEKRGTGRTTRESRRVTSGGPAGPRADAADLYSRPHPSIHMPAATMQQAMIRTARTDRSMPMRSTVCGVAYGWRRTRFSSDARDTEAHRPRSARSNRLTGSDGATGRKPVTARRRTSRQPAGELSSRQSQERYCRQEAQEAGPNDHPLPGEVLHKTVDRVERSPPPFPPSRSPPSALMNFALRPRTFSNLSSVRRDQASLSS